MSQLSSPFKSHDETGKRENGKTGKRQRRLTVFIGNL